MRTAIALFVVIVGCSLRAADPKPREQAMAWPKDWADHLGKTVTVEGKAIDYKVGAVLESKAGSIYVDKPNGSTHWPNGYWNGDDKSKRLRVTGVVTKRDDLPVFVQRKGALPLQGIPVKSKEEAEKAKWRYLLKDTKWTVIE